MEFLNACTLGTSTLVPGSDWRYVNELLSATEDEFGSSPSPEKDPLSTSRSRPEFHILLVEDNKADVFLIREAIGSSHLSAELRVVSDGEAAIQLIDDLDANDANWCPSLFLLDLNLPKKSGLDVLRHIRQSRRCGQAAILIITSSDSESDRAKTAQLGANGYFRKPSGYDAFIQLGEVIREMLTGLRET